jgi:hypothetical protein
LRLLRLATASKNRGRIMNVKWQPTFPCPHGCDKFFGSSVALKWHLEEYKEEAR